MLETREGDGAVVPVFEKPGEWTDVLAPPSQPKHGLYVNISILAILLAHTHPHLLD